MRKRKSVVFLFSAFAAVWSIAAAEETEPPAVPSPARVREVVGELRSALRGGDVTLNSAELEGTFYALRRAVTLRGVERAQNGTLMRILRDDSGAEPLPDLILLSGVAVKNGGEWAGFIYPTGMRAAVTGTEGVPVFCDEAGCSAHLVLRFLELRGGTPASSTGTASQAGNVQGVDSKGGYTGRAGNYGIQGFYWNIGWPGPWRSPPPLPPRPPHPPPPPHPGGLQTAR